MARRESELLGHDHVGSEHYLLAVLDQGDSRASSDIETELARLETTETFAPAYSPGLTDLIASSHVRADVLQRSVRDRLPTRCQPYEPRSVPSPRTRPRNFLLQSSWTANSSLRRSSSDWVPIGSRSRTNLKRARVRSPGSDGPGWASGTRTPPGPL
jgi:hypothetical protein